MHGRAALALIAAALAIVIGAWLAHRREEPPPRPLIPELRGPRREVEPHLDRVAVRVARRVERLRDLRFESVPAVRLMTRHQLVALGRRLTLRARRHRTYPPGARRRQRRLVRASVRLDQLAGLLPPEIVFGPDTTGGLDRVGGAYDYSRNRIVIVPRLIATHAQLIYTLAHELTHALEHQRFGLDFPALTRPGEAVAVRRALIEGTATLVQDRYRHRFLGDRVPVVQRLEGLRSVIAAGPAPFAVNAQAVFDYVDGALFVRRLYHRGGWAEVDRAIRNPPRSSSQILHPRLWPRGPRARPVRLGLRPLLERRWRRIGGGEAGEDEALVILLAGSIEEEATAGASGWDGGRFELWRPRGQPVSGCRPACANGDVGVVALRWRRPSDADQFRIAFPAYVIAGLLGERVTARTWKTSTGYVSLGRARRASALAFAPAAPLAQRLAARAAREANAAVAGLSP